MRTFKNALSSVAVVAAIVALTGVTTFHAHAASDRNMSDSGMKQCMAMMSNTGDVDADFITNMIPHHQMALEMARKELQKGKDPQARELARNIIDAQNKEIAIMKTWLKGHK
jgi:uncharacterized protein (DUF305 family)